MNRRRLPNRRRAETCDIAAGGIKATATIGFDEGGKPTEVFLNSGKAGSAIDALLGDAAVVISIALQHGIPASALAKALRVPEVLDGPAVKAASPIGASTRWAVRRFETPSDFLTFDQAFDPTVGMIESRVENLPMVTFFTRLISDESGVTAIEYGLITALIVIGSLVAVNSTSLSLNLSKTFGTVAAKL